MKQKMGKHLEFILRDMCSRVGAKFNKIDFKKPNWFMDYTWTQKQEDEFAKWMGDYLYTHKEAQDEVLASRISTKKLMSKAVMMFLFDYGWSIKND